MKEPDSTVGSRKKGILIAVVVVLLVAGLVSAVVWALMEQQPKVAPSVASPSPTAELRIYGGLPNTANYGHPVIVLTNIGYLSGYCEAHRNPAWVGFSISSITVGATAKRPPKFFTDTRTISRVAHEDYTNSGYDRGHMAPNYAIATRYGNEAQRETFLMSNITPQAPNLNRIWWRLLEEKEANDFAMRLKRVWVLTGPVFSGDVKKLRGGVDVPAACYRIILDEENGQPRALATPCTAPLLAPALGFAFAQPPLLILLLFLAIGAGLALPYLLLTFQPAWLKYLPRPGNWMVHFKHAMGFPMLATAIWLLWVATRIFGRDGALWLGLFLVVLALAAWIWGEFVQRGGERRGLAMGISLALLAGAYGYALEGQLHWRNPARPAEAGAITKHSPEGIDWQPWSLEAVAKARAEGRVVLVDFTADWCFTCKANLKSSLEIPATQQKLKALNAIALLADNTLETPAIAAELKKFGRAGVPMVLVYPRDAKADAILLPTLLTPSLVAEALDQAAK